MVSYPLKMKDHTYVLAYLQINKMKEMSMGKYLNLIIDEYVLNKAKSEGDNPKFRTYEERCFLCGKKATWKATFHSTIFSCDIHFHFFKNKYSSYLSTWKELKIK
jgi:hypothetical protein